METEFVPLMIKLLPFFLGVGASLLLLVIYLTPRVSNIVILSLFYKPMNQLYKFLSTKWEFDGIYNQLINTPILRFSYDTTFKDLDKGVIEYYGPYSLANTALFFGRALNEEQTGRIYAYA